jgi:hypothetical protein
MGAALNLLTPQNVAFRCNFPLQSDTGAEHGKAKFLGVSRAGLELHSTLVHSQNADDCHVLAAVKTVHVDENYTIGKSTVKTRSHGTADAARAGSTRLAVFAIFCTARRRESTTTCNCRLFASPTPGIIQPKSWTLRPVSCLQHACNSCMATRSFQGSQTGNCFAYTTAKSDVQATVRYSIARPALLDAQRRHDYARVRLANARIASLTRGRMMRN